jgi:Mg2+ and Co2+ transporter CorA
MFDKHIILDREALLTRQEQQIMNEEFSYESFVSWAARKLKGYSIKEIDYLAKRVVNIDTHEEKTEVIERIRDALRAAEEELEKKQFTKTKCISCKEDTAKRDQLKYMQEHIGILKVLLSKAQSFNIVDHLESQKNGGSSGGENGDNVYRIGDNT